MREGDGVKKKGVRKQRQMTEITMTSDWESELDKSGSLCETVQNTWKMLKIMRTMEKRMKTKGRKQSRGNKRREADRGAGQGSRAGARQEQGARFTNNTELDTTHHNTATLHGNTTHTEKL